MMCAGRDSSRGPMIEQWVDEAVPVLVTAEVRRESIAIIAPGELDSELAEVATAELDRLAAARFVIVDLTRCDELGRAGRALLTRVHAWLPVGAELAVVASAPRVVEELGASALGRSLPCYSRLEDSLADARATRAEFAAARTIDPAGPGHRFVGSELRYSADWL